MTPAMRGVVGAALAAAVGVGLAALSRAPYEPRRQEQSLLRLSWRARGERVEACRHLSAEEVAALPIHMRRTEICEGRVLPYHLTVELDGRTVLRDVIHAAGAREDRPLYVFYELPVTAGPHQLAVRFVRETVERDDDVARNDEHERDDDERDEDEPDFDGLDEDERREPGEDHRDGSGAGATPARLELVEGIDILAGEVALVTYDADLRTLVTRTPAP
jgi:hypothetical protein